jgi:GntR family transcriptional regulator, transcriptional repressor for pyruvate dehydrogenase complex
VPDPALQPISRSPLYEQVAERLRAFIETERLQPGDRLMSERELAERLGVSRTSVRQALTALKVMGLVEIRHGDGVYLLRTTNELIPSLASEIADSELDHPMIWEVREGIEVQAARLAAERRTQQDLADMRRALDAMAASVEAGGDGVDGDRDFHRAVVAAAHNPLLRKLTEQLSDAIDRTSAASLTHVGRPPISLEHHRAILDAIERCDAPDAAEQMQLHVTASRVAVAPLPRD